MTPLMQSSDGPSYLSSRTSLSESSRESTNPLTLKSSSSGISKFVISSFLRAVNAASDVFMNPAPGSPLNIFSIKSSSKSMIKDSYKFIKCMSMR